MSIVNFSGIHESEATIVRTWEEFRTKLANKEFLYNDLFSARSATFFKAFEGLMDNCMDLFTTTIDQVLSADEEVIRAAKIGAGDPVPSYSRFIPNSAHIKGPNRFSPPGIEWLYLAFAPKGKTASSTRFSIAQQTALKECRATSGDCFALCHFQPEATAKSLSIIDFTIAKELSYSTINNYLENKLNEYKKQLVSKTLTTGKIAPVEKGYVEKITKAWVAPTYAKLLSEQIFLPITTEDKEIMYAPFHTIAWYLLQKGFHGIVYSSTVNPEGKNIVLFDKNYASPTGTILYPINI